MKELFIPCSFSKLRINELFSLIDLLATAAEAMLKTPEAKAPTAELRTAATYLDTALKQSDINKYTATVEMADQAVDEAWSGIWALTKALLKHPNLERRARPPRCTTSCTSTATSLTYRTRRNTGG